jgi:hypothetical protein
MVLGGIWDEPFQFMKKHFGQEENNFAAHPVFYQSSSTEPYKYLKKV